MMTITVAAFSRSKAIHCTTMHTIMNIHMFCMIKNIHMDVHFLRDRASLTKLFKNTDRLIVLEYGSSLNQECIGTMCGPMPPSYNVMVFPAVKEGINWEMFKKKTAEGSSEPAHQRGLDFDTVLDKQIGESLWTVKSTEAMVWCMDTKQVDKKSRGAKDSVKLPVDSPKEFFDTLLKLGIKMCACSAAKCTVHYTHECISNIMESAGVNVQPAPQKV
jgi:hypothetical protein